MFQVCFVAVGGAKSDAPIPAYSYGLFLDPVKPVAYDDCDGFGFYKFIQGKFK